MATQTVATTDKAFPEYESLPKEVQLMLNTLENVAEPDDSIVASLNIMATILSQTTEESIFEAAEAGITSGDDYVNVPFRVHHDRISWRKSASQYTDEGAFPYFAQIRIADKEGKDVVLGCGGVSVVPTLFALWDAGIIEKYESEGGMPFILAQEKTNGGFDMLKLRKYVGPPF